MRRQPSASTGSRYFEGEIQDALDRQLTPAERGLPGGDGGCWRGAGLSELARYDGAPLSDAERVSAEVMRWQLQTMVDGWAHRDYQFPLQQFSGANVSLPNLMTVVHPVRSAAGRGQLRGAAAADRRADGRGGGAVGAAGGAGNPAAALHPAGDDRADAPVRLGSTRGQPAGRHVRRAPGARSRRWTRPRAAPSSTQATAIVEAEVYPAWRKAIAVLEAQLPAATDDAGLWRFQDGARGLRGPAAAVHLDQARRAGDPRHRAARSGAHRRARWTASCARLGRTEGSVKERMARLKKDLAYSDDAPGPRAPHGRHRAP